MVKIFGFSLAIETIINILLICGLIYLYIRFVKIDNKTKDLENKVYQLEIDVASLNEDGMIYGKGQENIFMSDDDYAY
jgi:hypothetical protein